MIETWLRKWLHNKNQANTPVVHSSFLEVYIKIFILFLLPHQTKSINLSKVLPQCLSHNHNVKSLSFCSFTHTHLRTHPNHVERGFWLIICKRCVLIELLKVFTWHTKGKFIPFFREFLKFKEMRYCKRLGVRPCVRLCHVTSCNLT